MNINTLIERSWLTRIALIVWLVSAVFVVFTLNRLDTIVHKDLYDYGLQFSFAWATPFWNFENFIYIILAVPAVLTCVSLTLDFFRRGKSELPTIRRVESKPANGKLQNGKENSMLVNCPKCHKVFGKPLSMLDFSMGKTRLVNVCPYCNHVLGDAEREEKDDVQVVDLNRRVVQ
jgi:hypothetical protein